MQAQLAAIEAFGGIGACRRRPGPRRRCRYDGTRWTRFLHSDLAAAWVLVAAVAVALVWANGSWAHTYDATWLHPSHVGGRAFDGFTTVRDWVNGGLMAVFFLVVGLEIGRERRHGDLADARTAVVPVAGALGGMAGAGLVYAAGHPRGTGGLGLGDPHGHRHRLRPRRARPAGPPGAQRPAGLPVDPGRGRRHRLGGWCWPSSTRPARVRWPWSAAVVVVVVLVVLRRRSRAVDVTVVLAGAVGAVGAAGRGRSGAGAGRRGGRPARPGSVGGRRPRPGGRLERRVAPWSAFVVLPLFALANAGITFHSGMLASRRDDRGVLGGGPRPGRRQAGRYHRWPAGWWCVAGLGHLPDGVRWRHLAGGAAVAGIGFTVPLLIAELAFVHRAAIWWPPPSSGCSPDRPLAFAVGAAVLCCGRAAVRSSVPDRRRWRHRWRGGGAADPLVTGRVTGHGRRTVCCGQGRRPA